MQAQPPTLKSFIPFGVGALFGLVMGFSVFYVGARYQISSYSGGYSNLHIPVFIKFDRWTGASWLATGTNGKWRRFEDEIARQDQEDKDTAGWEKTNHLTEADDIAWGITNRH